MDKTVSGVVVEYNGKYWGVNYEDGKCLSYGWVDIDLAKIVDAQFISKPEDMTFGGSSNIKELQKGKLVKVTRKIVITHQFE